MISVYCLVETKQIIGNPSQLFNAIRSECWEEKNEEKNVGDWKKKLCELRIDCFEVWYRLAFFNVSFKLEMKLFGVVIKITLNIYRKDLWLLWTVQRKKKYLKTKKRLILKKSNYCFKSNEGFEPKCDN